MRPTRLLWTTLFAVILAGGILLVLANPEPITVELYFTQFTYPAGLVLLLTLLAGIGVCVLLGGTTLLYYRNRIARLQKISDTAQEEVQNLRRMIVHDREE